MKTIILTGMMGSGKTTIANLLNSKLNIKTLDIDTIIEENENLKISEIFKQKGEEYFRKIEKETIKETFNCENLIISLGGGALENSETREFLLKNSTVIYLKTSPKTIYERIKNDTSRPLLHDNMSIDKIDKILNQREQNYQCAQHIILTDDKTPIQVVESIIGVLQ